MLSLRMEGRTELGGSGGGGGESAAGPRPRGSPAAGTHRPGLLSPARPWPGPRHVTVLGRSPSPLELQGPRRLTQASRSGRGMRGARSLQGPGAWRVNFEAVAQSLWEFP